MKRFLRLIPLLLPLAPTVQAQDKTIYGQDGRKDLYEVRNPVVRAIMTGSAVSIFSDSHLKSEGGNYRVKGRLFGDEARMICPTERFLDQPSAAFCSGTLIAPDLVLTAGHCMAADESGADRCASSKFVFGYAVAEPGRNPGLIPSAEVYSCSSVTVMAATRSADYALVRLDRAVTGHAPAGTDLSAPRAGMSIFTVGGPYGLPIKAAEGGNIRSVNISRAYMTTDLDTSGGNSGGGVFNASTGRLIAVHTASRDPDLVEIPLPAGHGLPATDRRVVQGICKTITRFAENGGEGKKAYLLSVIPGLAGLTGAESSHAVAGISMDPSIFTPDSAEIDRISSSLR